MTFEEYQQIPNKEWWQITDLGYWDAGAASRDAEIAELVAALEGYLDAINASARAEMAYANARENFTDSIDEGKAARAALVAASKAEGVARATLAKVRKP